MKYILKILILLFFVIIIYILFFCNKEKFHYSTSNIDLKDETIILNKNLFVNYNYRNINKIIDDYSYHNDPLKNTSKEEGSSVEPKKYEIPGSRNNKRDLLKHNLFINNNKKSSGNNLKIENELCIGEFCLNDNMLSKVGGMIDGPHFYSEKYPEFIVDGETTATAATAGSGSATTATTGSTSASVKGKPIYYNNDNLIPMAKSVCINNTYDLKGLNKLPNITCLNSDHFDMINGNKGLRLYGGGDKEAEESEMIYDSKVSSDDELQIRG